VKAETLLEQNINRPQEVMTVDLLSELFETPLLVDKHPQSGNPRVFRAMTGRG
jgi:ABC-type hemin transport system ATPase subunit